VIANGIANQACNGVAIKSAHDVGSARFGSLHIEAQRASHFLAALAFDQ